MSGSSRSRRTSASPPASTAPPRRRAASTCCSSTRTRSSTRARSTTSSLRARAPRARALRRTHPRSRRPAQSRLVLGATVALEPLLLRDDALDRFKALAVFDPEAIGGWKRDTVREVGIVTGCLLLAPRAVWHGSAASTALLHLRRGRRPRDSRLGRPGCGRRSRRTRSSPTRSASPRAAAPTSSSCSSAAR